MKAASIRCRNNQMTTIENRRFALMVAGGVVLFLLYQAWQKDYAPKSGASAQSAPVPEAAPAAPAGDAPATRDAPPVTATAKPDAGAAIPAPAGTRIRVRTDLLAVELSTQGGDIRRVELLGFPVAKKQPDQNVALLDDQADRWFVIQSGLTGTAGAIVSHKDVYRAAADTYALGDADQIEVPLQFTDAQGRSVVKTYTFRRGSYVVDLKQRLVNSTAAAVAVNPYVQLWRTPFQVGEEPPFTPTFMGMGLYEQKAGGESYRFRKVKFDDLPDEAFEVKQTGGWVAMLQHYFLAAVIPPAGEGATLIGKPSSSRGFVGQYIGAAHEVPAQGQQDFAAQLYVGPKLQQKLETVAPGLELALDYGILSVLAKPLFWLLDWFHGLTKNWGAAIILLTLAVRLLMYKLSEAQYRGMAKMKKYAPRIQELKERYGDDRERMHKAMMELYKKEKFNPLAGCWPLLIQFPVFIALYWVLLESVELRQADFALWLNDLSSPDPYYVMPVLYGISMFVQQKLSGNVAMDPMQQRVMNMMPVMLTVFFAFFPVGLVLYWLVSSLIGIAQQWYIVRKLTHEGLRQ
jgi:YidC/Oxa1 family membrane protein insertase